MRCWWILLGCSVLFYLMPYLPHAACFPPPLQDMVVLPYKDSLLLFSRYLQQLIMESLGKELDLDNKLVREPEGRREPLQWCFFSGQLAMLDLTSTCQSSSNAAPRSILLCTSVQVNQGLTVYGNKGSTDQHA